MNVLHVINTAEIGGGGTHLLHLIPHLRAHGYPSDVVVGRDGPTADRLRRVGAAVTVVGPLGLSAPLRLARVFRRTRPDLVHLHGSRAGVAGTIAAALTGVRPVVYTAHALAFKRHLPAMVTWLLARADALTCARADRVICLTHSDVEAARARRVLRDRVTVIPNAIDPAPFASRPDRRAELGIDPDAPVAGMVGRLVPDKDPVGFIAAARRVVDVLPHTRFLLVGDGPLRTQVENAIASYGLGPHVILTGYRSDIPELLATMDVVVLTSRWEGMPLVILEAMASARPVIAPALPGLDEVISDGVTGRLVAPGVPGAAADAIVALLRDPAARQAMGVCGRERVYRRFTLARMVSSTLAVYQAALAGGGSSRCSVSDG